MFKMPMLFHFALNIFLLEAYIECRNVFAPNIFQSFDQHEVPRVAYVNVWCCV